jgi:hypothetical protein
MYRYEFEQSRPEEEKPMHPILIADLAAERHADLLREAAARRRLAGPARRSRRTALSRAADGLDRAMTGLRGRLAAPTQPKGELCCA